jgi:hypothetical protein
MASSPSAYSWGGGGLERDISDRYNGSLTKVEVPGVMNACTRESNIVWQGGGGGDKGRLPGGRVRIQNWLDERVDGRSERGRERPASERH